MNRLFILLFFIISCQTNDSSVTTVPASHIGEWETECYSNGNGTYGIINLNIASTHIELTTGVFSDVTCSTQEGEFYFESDSYVRTTNTYSTSLVTYQFTPLTVFHASTLNNINYCGLSPAWGVGGIQSLFDLTCVGNNPQIIDDEHPFIIQAVRTGDTLTIESVKTGEDGDTPVTAYTEKVFYKI
jgi:hypothetical protein